MERNMKNNIVSAVWVFGVVLLAIAVILFIISLTTHNGSLRTPSIILSLVATTLGFVRAIIR